MVKQVSLALLATVLFASFGGSALAGDFKVFLDYACLNIDGIPVPRYSNLADRCCGSNAASDELCKAGFFSIMPDSLEENGHILDGVYDLLEEANTLSGNSADLSLTPDNSNPNNEAEGSTSSEPINTQISALTSIGDLSNLSGPGPNSQNPAGGQLQGSSGGGMLGLTGLGAGSSDSWSSRRGKKKFAVPGSEATEPGSGRYASLGSGPSMVPGSGGPFGVTSSSLGVEVVEYGVDPSKAGEEIANGARDEGKSDPSGAPGGAGSETGGLAGAGGSLASGANLDAADYLSRIHKKDSIFKIVSLRYKKEVDRKSVLIPGKK